MSEIYVAVRSDIDKSSNAYKLFEYFDYGIMAESGEREWLCAN